MDGAADSDSCDFAVSGGGEDYPDEIISSSGSDVEPGDVTDSDSETDELQRLHKLRDSLID